MMGIIVFDIILLPLIWTLFYAANIFIMFHHFAAGSLAGS